MRFGGRKLEISKLLCCDYPLSCELWCPAGFGPWTWSDNRRRVLNCSAYKPLDRFYRSVKIAVSVAQSHQVVPVASDVLKVC